MRTPTQIIGRILKTDLPKGSAFDTAQLYPEGVYPNPADRLAPGFRAVTIPVDAMSAVGGFATPGAWVDVMFRADENEDEDLPELTVTLVESVEVLALNEHTFTGSKSDDPNGRDAKEMAVTLAVRPEQAAALRVVDGRGTLSLMLRNPNDDTPTALNIPRTMHDVLDRPYTKWRMQVYRGGSLSSVDFRRNQRDTPTVDEIATKVAGNPAKPDAAPPGDK
jgi:pilus assembly protein CpaB